jgi:thiol-disulfide isomerase/thioredoxin
MYKSSVTLRLLFLASMHFLSVSLSAQKQFRLIVNIPQSIHPEKMEVWLNNGKGLNKIKPETVTRQQIILAGDYYSLYAAINLQYPTDGSAKGFAKEFFVGEKLGTIKFASPRGKDAPFANYSLQNVVDFEQEKQQMENYTAAERKKAMDFENQYGDALFSGNDTAIRNHYFKVVMPELGRKKLEYIVAHPNSYYFFYIFRTAVAKPNIVSWDSLQRVFQAFPDKFKYSDEGNYLNAFLHSRQLSIGSADAVDFTAKDIDKNNVSLSQFKGSKYVLLHFWATWCTPCMRELPALKQINDQYAEKGLQTISIALKSNDADYGKAIKKYQLNWIHIYDDLDLMNKYGNQPTPRICLIDKTSKIIYDTIGSADNDDLQLTGLKEKLKKVLRE